MESDRETIAQRYALLESSELIRILKVDSAGYEPEALEVAYEVLRERGLSEDSFKQAAEDLEEDLANEKEIEFGHLSRAGKIACFLVIPSYFILFGLELDGRMQATRDARRWRLYGLLFWSSLGFVMLLSRSNG